MYFVVAAVAAPGPTADGQDGREGGGRFGMEAIVVHTPVLLDMLLLTSFNVKVSGLLLIVKSFIVSTFSKSWGKP